MAGTATLCLRRLCLAVGVLALVAASIPFAPSRAAAQAGPPQVTGVNAHLFTYLANGTFTHADVDQALDLAAELGVDAVRMAVSWPWLEGHQNAAWNNPAGYNQHNLGLLDYVMLGAATRGLQVVAMVSGVPCWASTAPRLLGQCLDFPYRHTRYRPSNPATYGDFVRFLSWRYEGTLRGIETWNEVNRGDWSMVSLDGSEKSAWANMIRQAYLQRHSDATEIYTGSLHGTDNADLGQHWTEWMDAAWPIINDHYDAWILHDYTVGVGPSSQTVRQYERLQAKEGSNPVRVVISEYGRCTASAADTTAEQCGNPATEAQQADAIVAKLSALGTLDYVVGAYQYELVDIADPNVAGYHKGFGLVRASWVKKQSFDALRDYLSG